MKLAWKPFWTPTYVVNKIRYLIFINLHPNAPWLTPSAIRYLDKHLSNNHTGLEIGAGNSTIWLASRIKMLTSIEHDSKWFNCVKEKLLRHNIQNVQLLLADSNGSGDPALYLQLLKNLHDRYDFILVDGIYRDLCTEIVIDKLNSGGIFVLDDCHRYLPGTSNAPYARKSHEQPLTERWQAFAQKVKNWTQLRTSDGMRDTCIFIKPHAK